MRLKGSEPAIMQPDQDLPPAYAPTVSYTHTVHMYNVDSNVQTL